LKLGKKKCNVARYGTWAVTPMLCSPTNGKATNLALPSLLHFSLVSFEKKFQKELGEV
jgi:hypothetical protein